MLDEAEMKGFLSINMLGGAGTNKIFFAENLKRSMYEKGPLTHYIRRGWHEKVLFTENTGRDWFKHAPITQYLRRGWHEKALFTENARRGWFKKAPLNQYFRCCNLEKAQFIENARREWYGIISSWPGEISKLVISIRQSNLQYSTFAVTFAV